MIVDIRDYTMVPGGRAKMLERFHGIFMDEQERLGAKMLGIFLDADDDSKALWLRAMPDLDTRKRVLTQFYAEGEMWKANRDEVNSWFIDTDNVLLVHPVGELAAPEPQGATTTVAMYTHLGREPLSSDAKAALSRDVPAAIAEAGARVLGTFELDRAENNYPKHPIREGEHGLVWFATFGTKPYKPLALAQVSQRRLIPTARSRMR